MHDADAVSGQIVLSGARGDELNFYIQAGNPRFQEITNVYDESLSDAIESVFPLNTENAILVWNHICVPLSYKYDISYMMEDILQLLDKLQNKEKGELRINWLPDTFRCDWFIKWNTEEIKIQSRWECTVGDLENILNQRPNVELSKQVFINEWKSVLGIVIEGLKGCGYSENEIRHMDQLIERFESMKEDGQLYKR
ncbi:MAG: hypothetical protein Q4C82_04905 [Eubacteriales bacterium]|nr:hypothetical protein [Eubacteriales bacterium]